MDNNITGYNVDEVRNIVIAAQKVAKDILVRSKYMTLTEHELELARAFGYWCENDTHAQSGDVHTVRHVVRIQG